MIHKTFDEISTLIRKSFTTDTFFPSRLNDDESFFRFKIGNNTFKLHYFHNYNPKDENDIEATLHVYEGPTKIGSYFGEIEDIIDRIKK